MFREKKKICKKKKASNEKGCNYGKEIKGINMEATPVLWPPHTKS